MRRVAVSGASGFVGRAVVRRLAREGIEVVALVRDATVSIDGAASTVAIGDLRAPTGLDDALHGCDAVVHLAAWVHQMGVDGATALEAARAVNVEGTTKMVEAAARASVGRMVYMSSIKVMGEERATAFTEADTPVPAGAYAGTKLEAEHRLLKDARPGEPGVTVLRPPLVYGPGVRANFASLMRFVDRVGVWPFGAAANRRSLIYVENLADAVAAVLRSPATVGRVYLLDDGEAVSTAVLMRRMAAALDRKIVVLPFRGDGFRVLGRILGRDETTRRLLGSMFVDMSNLRRDADWTPPYSLDEGLRATATWFKSIKP